MPLVNVYNYLSSVKPHITYRFNCDIWPYNYLDNNRESDGGYERRTFTIKKITQPTFKLDTEAKKYYGNTQFVIPVFKFGDTEMSITFEETDNMEVFKFLCNCYGQIAYMRSAVSNLINIEVTQFDETMHNVVDRKHYIATLKSFENPSFNNNGYGSPVEISADFYVLYVYDEPLSNEKIDDKIAINHDGEGFIQDVMDAADYSNHITGGKNAENLVDQEIKAAPGLGGFKKNPKNEKRKQEIREEQANIREAQKNIVSDQYNNMFDSLSDEGKQQLAEAAIDEYTKRNKGKKRETAYEEFNADKGLFIAKYLDNVTAEDGLSKDEIDAIAANLKQLGADEKTIELFATAVGVYDKKYDELEKEYTTLEQIGASSASDKKKVNTIEKTQTGDVMSDGNGNSITVTNVKTVNDNKIAFVEDSKHNDVTFELPKSVVFHNQAAKNMHMETAIYNAAEYSVAGTSDASGNLMFDTDMLYYGNKGSGAKGKSKRNPNNENANKPVALELPGAVAVVESEDGKYYVRQAGSKKSGVDYIEISKEEFDKRKGQQYTSETMEGDKQLVINYEYGTSGTKAAKNSDGTFSDIKIKNMYSEAITDENLNAAYLFGIAIRTEAEKEAARTGKNVNDYITEEYINSLAGYSHGMLDTSAGKMEGTPDDVRQLLSAVKQGLRGKSELNKEETKKARKHR